MNVYSAETKDGLANIIQANTSIAYTSPLLKLDDSAPIKEELFCKFAVANIDLNYDRFDLYPIYGVLVSTGINKNGDVFIPEEVWAARSSSEEKPFNLQHNGLDIIGHITACYPVDINFKQIANDTAVDQLPEKFHIVNASVIYKVWENSARQKQIAQIINEIEQGNKWALSMECAFRAYSYLIRKANGEAHILDRNERTASLTKHLRAYGGSGKFGEYEIHRVLRNIIFTGKGLVNNPANPESIIFSDTKNISFANLVYNISSELLNGETQMVDTVNIEKVLAELKDEVSKGNVHKMHALEAQIEALKKGADEHHRELEKRHGDLSALQKEHEEKMAAVGKELEEWKIRAEAAEKKVEEDEKEMARLKAETEYEKKVVKEYEDATKRAKRAEALKKTNIDSNRLNTEGLMDSLAAMDDATFDTMVKLFAKSDESTTADFGAHRIDGEPQTSDSTQTQDVDQFGKPKKPKNPLVEDCSVAANPNNVITAAVIEENANLGVSVDNIDKSYAKVQEQILNFLSPKKKK